MAPLVLLSIESCADLAWIGLCPPPGLSAYRRLGYAARQGEVLAGGGGPSVFVPVAGAECQRIHLRRGGVDEAAGRRQHQPGNYGEEHDS
jgi:hypothetical protein